MIDVDYTTLVVRLEDGSFRSELETELTMGFSQLIAEGAALPPASHYASRIANLIFEASPDPLPLSVSHDLYQEVLLAVESARRAIGGEETTPENENRLGP